MKRILIADDHPSIRKGVKTILTNEYSEVEFGEASSAAEVLKKDQEANLEHIEVLFELGMIYSRMPGRDWPARNGGGYKPRFPRRLFAGCAA